jgi:hypothetical protein
MYVVNKMKSPDGGGSILSQFNDMTRSELEESSNTNLPEEVDRRGCDDILLKWKSGGLDVLTLCTENVKKRKESADFLLERIEPT